MSVTLLVDWKEPWPKFWEMAASFVPRPIWMGLPLPWLLVAPTEAANRSWKLAVEPL